MTMAMRGVRQRMKRKALRRVCFMVILNLRGQK